MYILLFNSVQGVESNFGQFFIKISRKK